VQGSCLHLESTPDDAGPPSALPAAAQASRRVAGVRHAHRHNSAMIQRSDSCATADTSSTDAHRRAPNLWKSCRIRSLLTRPCFVITTLPARERCERTTTRAPAGQHRSGAGRAVLSGVRAAAESRRPSPHRCRGKPSSPSAPLHSRCCTPPLHLPRRGSVDERGQHPLHHLGHRPRLVGVELHDLRARVVEHLDVVCLR